MNSSATENGGRKDDHLQYHSHLSPETWIISLLGSLTPTMLLNLHSVKDVIQTTVSTSNQEQPLDVQSPECPIINSFQYHL